MSWNLKFSSRRFLQNTIILLVRPYVHRELLGWGKAYETLVGDYRRDWFWRDAPIKTIRGKLHNQIMQLDLSKWSDRSAYFLGRWYELGIQLLLSDVLKTGETVVDVGSNRGMFAIIASCLVGDQGRVICFEPNPNCLKVLEREIAANGISNIFVHRGGLGDHEEELVLSVPMINSGEGTFGQSAYGADAMYEVRAPVKIGDQLLADEKPSFIKIDVEGFECKVVRGLAQIITQHRPLVVTEVVPRHLLACGSSMAELKGLMESFGYQGYRLSLQKAQGRHDWYLTRFKAHEQYFDAVWLHSKSVRHRAILDHHLAC